MTDWELIDRLYEKYYLKREEFCSVCKNRLDVWREKRKKIKRCPICKVTTMRIGNRKRVIAR